MPVGQGPEELHTGPHLGPTRLGPTTSVLVEPNRKSTYPNVAHI